jgi:AbrB family looped-hinge helix DNA binding protein
MPMNETTVTSKGQVTIPKAVRQRLGIRTGSKVGFEVVGDHVELRLLSRPAAPSDSGFGLLKSRRASVPADFDAATLLHADRNDP